MPQTTPTPKLLDSTSAVILGGRFPLSDLASAFLLGAFLWSSVALVLAHLEHPPALEIWQALVLVGPGIVGLRRLLGLKVWWEPLAGAFCFSVLLFLAICWLFRGTFLQFPLAYFVMGSSVFLGTLVLRAVPPRFAHFRGGKILSGYHPIFLDEADCFAISEDALTLHTQIIGGTGTGKTAFAIKPMLEQAINLGFGAFVYDVKSNLVHDVACYMEVSGRDHQLYYFDLADPSRSQTYNPLAGSEPDQIANRLITALYFGDQSEPYYKDLASAFLSNLVPLLLLESQIITFGDLYAIIGTELSTFARLDGLCHRHPETLQALYFKENWLDSPIHERQKNLSGLINKLSRFVTRAWSPLVNARNPDITMAKVFEKEGVFVFGTSSLENPEDARPLAVMALMDLSAQVARRFHAKSDTTFLVFLDEFWNIQYPGFVDLINKAREAKVGFVLSHQSLGDLESVSQEFADQVLTNTQNKIILASSHPPTAEYMARLLGTQEGKPRQVYSYDTRAGSVGLSSPAGYTEVIQEEFIFHPNRIKNLGMGEAIVRITTPSGPHAQMIRLKPPALIPGDFSLDRVVHIRNRHKKPVDGLPKNSTPVSSDPTPPDKKKTQPAPTPKPKGKPDSLLGEIQDAPPDSNAKEGGEPS